MRFEPRIASISGSHLSDDQLMETYVVHGENRHLSACRDCKARFDELARALQHVREDANREADSIFTAERLHDQRDRIIKRLERHDHPGEVVMFPTRQVSNPVSRVLGPARRWVAGAAAAGLAAGMFLGFELDRRTRPEDIPSAIQASATAAAGQSAIARDEQFFNEVDDAMGARAMELLAIDAMTTPVEIREARYPQ